MKLLENWVGLRYCIKKKCFSTGYTCLPETISANHWEACLNMENHGTNSKVICFHNAACTDSGWLWVGFSVSLIVGAGADNVV